MQILMQILTLQPDRPALDQIAAAAGVELPEDQIWLESVGRGVALWDEHLAWNVAARSGRSLLPHQESARRLLLEIVEFEPGRGVLIHRAGWPFDLKTTPLSALPPGDAAAALRPTGSGDEVMRDLIESSGNDLWIWGDGQKPKVPNSPERRVVGKLDPMSVGLIKMLGWTIETEG